MGGLEPIPADTRRGRGTPRTSRQFITGLTYRDKQPFTHIHTYRQFRVPSWPNLHVFELLEEAGVSRENTHRHGRTWKLHTERCYPSWVSNQGPFCCEATVLTTKPSGCKCVESIVLHHGKNQYFLMCVYWSHKHPLISTERESGKHWDKHWRNTKQRQQCKNSHHHQLCEV